MAAGDKTGGMTSARLLAMLGERVRTLRAQRGMTRKALAADSGVSERYLAQLERGQGNMSVVLLARVAAALGTEPSDLLRSRESQTAEEVLITDLLRELSPDHHRAFLQILTEHFSVPVESRQRIALIGLRGAGKTSQGQLLAERLNLPFVQLGNEIERLAGMSSSEIFALSGATGYRRLEERALMQTLKRYDKCVLETPGGIVMDRRQLKILLTTCFVVWLYAQPEEYMRRLIAQGDVRPMENQADAMVDLRRILVERNERYSHAHVSLDTNGKSVADCVAELLRILPGGMQNTMNEAREA
ncbi:MAG: helix-turn-helix transcriptional regulator [Gammaproteobacteria bacterium]|nr:helix-turn-helix transcriptional regulator [Gammaproteobacteria bacterium]MDH3429489.1 helix-turn-helix transcriptional regulator [Gammaproteobacteria bacterium]MDH3432818.1 helix-turn-helix transcriptional regulator [Gammaproteobacteria bacterium]